MKEIVLLWLSQAIANTLNRTDYQICHVLSDGPDNDLIALSWNLAGKSMGNSRLWSQLIYQPHKISVSTLEVLAFPHCCNCQSFHGADKCHLAHAVDK